MSKRQKGILYAILILLLIGCSFAAYWQFYGRYHQTTNDAYVKGDITQISSRITGYVTALHVRDNHFVVAGAPLVSLDDRQLKIQLASAKARLDAAKAELASIQAGMVLDHDKISLAKARIAEAGATLTNARQRLERIRALKGRNYAAQSQLDSAKAAVKSGEASVAAAKAEYQAAVDQVNLTRTNLKKADASVVAARAQVNQAALDLSHAVIKSPVNGIITNRNVNEGMFVSAGMPLLSLVPLDSIWIEANFKETQLENLKPGQPVTVYLDAYPGNKITGQIDSIAPGSGSEFSLLPPDNATGNFTKVVQRIPVKITIHYPEKLQKALYPGLSAHVDVNTGG